ncbi:MAG: hypothetical protein KC657_14400 [Myxococcales bacterium]|nr:hypothetical protein [Myxococcales bacterium]
MITTRTKMISTVTVAMLGLAAATGGCSDDPSPASDAGTTADTSTSQDATTGTDSSTPNDASTGNDAATDAGSDASSATIPDGKYVLQTWTCTNAGGGNIDVKAFAATLQIMSVEVTFSGATGSIDVIYPAGCVRTVPIKSITYPSAGNISTIAGGNRTCTVACPANQCTAGVEPDTTDSYAYTVAGATLTYTRPYVSTASLQMAAGCATGDTETVVYMRQ